MEETVDKKTGSRRTRSTRKTSGPALAATPTRSTRRSKKQIEQAIEEEVNNVDEDVEEEVLNDVAEEELLNSSVEEEKEGYEPPSQSNVIQEMLQEAAQGIVVDTEDEFQDEQIVFDDEEQVLVSGEEEIVFEQIEEDPQETQQDEGFVITENMNFENDGVMEKQQDEECVNAETVVENDTETGILQEHEVTESINQDIEMTEQPSLEQTVTANVDEENGSSFPFGGGGSVQQSENSDNKVEEQGDLNTAEVDSSLLASLVGDNANSLPSVGDESQSKEIFDNEDPNIHDETTHSENAIAQDLPNGEDTDKTINTVDAEMVSEDELQNTPPQKPKIKDAEEVSDDELVTPKIKVKDAEEVSDEELPAPKRAELPADAEVISEDELPSSCNVKKESHKRKAEKKTKNEEYNPSSPTGEESNDGAPEKKVKIDEKEVKEKKKEKKKLPELDKYWKAVKDDPADFTGWTYLLQYVDQETDAEAARDAYDAFLSHYPYCYGYWRKYADYEKRKGDKEKCYEVFERGLKAIPLSVDLWMHYLAHIKSNHADNEEHVRTQFNRAIESCGLEFRSDKLWELYIKWETESNRFNRVLKIYDRLLAIPTQGYNAHFESFQDLINSHAPNLTIGTEEFKKLRHDIRESAKKSKSDRKHKEKDAGSDSPPGDEKPIDDPEEADDHVRNDEEMSAIKDKIISSRRKIHKSTVAAVTARWSFEEGIKRPYFHVKPLERSQLKNWKEYLQFEIEKGDRKRILILFERCLIACALYDEFWLKLIRYLETLQISHPNDLTLIDLTRDAYTRACTIHHLDKPSMHLMWAAFEELNSNLDKASEILIKLDERCPNLLQIAYRRINLERRRGNYDKCSELYEHYIKNAKSKNIAGSLSIKYARFCQKILRNLDKSIQTLKEVIDKDPGNTRVALQMIDLALQREKVDEKEIVEIMDKFVARDNIDPDQKVLFAQRKVEFLEDFGTTAKGLQEAQRALQIALTKAGDAKKKNESSPNNKGSKDPKPPPGGPNPAYNTNNYYGAGAAQAYYNSGQQQAYQQSYDSYGYNHWQYGSGYSGYGQWGGYGNYY